jgi:hypothetical protein
MKARNILIALLVLAMAGLGFQVWQFSQALDQAQHPPTPAERFATHPGAATPEEIERGEKLLEQKAREAAKEAASHAPQPVVRPASTPTVTPAATSVNMPAVTPAATPSAKPANAASSAK